MNEISKLINKYSYLPPDKNIKMQYVLSSCPNASMLLQKKLNAVNEIYSIIESFDNIIEYVIMNNEFKDIQHIEQIIKLALDKTKNIEGYKNLYE